MLDHEHVFRETKIGVEDFTNDAFKTELCITCMRPRFLSSQFEA
jgi:hypothetical protein